MRETAAVERIALTYHDVVPPAGRDGSGFRGPGPDHYKLAPTQFAAQLDAILATGVSPVLTFDDGGRSAVDTIAPLLEERGLHGHFFVVADRVGTPGFVDADGVRSLAAAGHLVGSHGLTHRPLPPLDDDELAREWVRSREVLGEILGSPVGSASVPRGFYDARVGRAAAAAGYEELYTSEPWRTPRRLESLTLRGRFAVVASTPTERVVALAKGSRRAIVPAAASWQARKAAKRALGPVYELLRRRLIERH